VAAEQFGELHFLRPPVCIDALEYEVLWRRAAERQRAALRGDRFELAS
jgi:hypothetical protein